MEPKIEPQGTFDSIRSAWVMKNIDFEREVVTLSFREAEWIDTCLRLAEHAPSSPAAPTPHMNAAEFYREVWIKENGSDPRGDWPIRMAEAYAASETARADRAEREKESWRISYETHWKALQEAKSEIQRKDAALQTLITAAEDLLRFVTNPQNIPANNLRRHIEKLRTTPEVTTSV